MVEVTDAELDQEARELLAHLNSVPFAHEYRMEGETYGQIVDVLRRLIDGRAALRARIAEDQAQIAALTTYRDNLRDEVIELRARIAELEAERAEWVEVERLRMGKPTPPTPPA